MISDAIITEAVELLRQAAPRATIILFGSYARGEATEESDLDFLIIEPEVKARREEMVRLRDVLRPLRIPVDVLVVGRQTCEEWADTPGTVLYEAAREGSVYYRRTHDLVRANGLAFPQALAGEYPYVRWIGDYQGEQK